MTQAACPWQRVASRLCSVVHCCCIFNDPRSESKKFFGREEDQEVEQRRQDCGCWHRPNNFVNIFRNISWDVTDEAHSTKRSFRQFRLKARNVEAGPDSARTGLASTMAAGFLLCRAQPFITDAHRHFISLRPPLSIIIKDAPNFGIRCSLSARCGIPSFSDRIK